MIDEIYKYIIGFVLALILTPIRKLIYSEEEKFCAFIVQGGNEKVSRVIKVTKWFKKTTSINCGWFEERKKSEFNGNKFLYCPFGHRPPRAKTYHGGYCPFEKKPKFKNV